MAVAAENADDLPAAPSMVSMAPFSPSPRRLSSQFAEPRRPVPAPRPLAWVSLQGRVVNAEEASSARAIGGGVSRDVAVAWQLFSPIHRFMIVAVIGAAAAESKKNSLIRQLKKSVELRDQVLTSMQQKLDDLCEQLNSAKDNTGTGAKDVETLYEGFGSENIRLVDCGCWLCDQHADLSTILKTNSGIKTGGGDELVQHVMKMENNGEQEERRMSDLSDWASSVTSSAEIQLNNLAIEQDIFNLKRECEEKDAIIKELTSCVKSSNAAGSRRISELEEIIRRKNTTITRLKKDMVVLEQKLVQLTRLQRSSSSTSSLNCWQLPVMNDNVLYDMDSTTSPSSSDSDASPQNHPQTSLTKVEKDPRENGDFASTRDQRPTPALAWSPLVMSQSASPLREISMNEKSDMTSSRQRQLSASGDLKRTRRRAQSALKNATPGKRWL